MAKNSYIQELKINLREIDGVTLRLTNPISKIQGHIRRAKLRSRSPAGQEE
jgi:hypothetical protein